MSHSIHSFFLIMRKSERDRPPRHLLSGSPKAASCILPRTCILDISTGTDIWEIEMGYDLLSVEVLGMDIIPTQPPMIPRCAV
jgi:hypothetical protein